MRLQVSFHDFGNNEKSVGVAGSVTKCLILRKGGLRFIRAGYVDQRHGDGAEVAQQREHADREQDLARAALHRGGGEVVVKTPPIPTAGCRWPGPS